MARANVLVTRPFPAVAATFSGTNVLSKSTAAISSTGVGTQNGCLCCTTICMTVYMGGVVMVVVLGRERWWGQGQNIVKFRCLRGFMALSTPASQAVLPCSRNGRHCSGRTKWFVALLPARGRFYRRTRTKLANCSRWRHDWRCGKLHSRASRHECKGRRRKGLPALVLETGEIRTRCTGLGCFVRGLRCWCRHQRFRSFAGEETTALLWFFLQMPGLLSATRKSHRCTYSLFKRMLGSSPQPNHNCSHSRNYCNYCNRNHNHSHSHSPSTIKTTTQLQATTTILTATQLQPKHNPNTTSAIITVAATAIATNCKQNHNRKYKLLLHLQLHRSPTAAANDTDLPKSGGGETAHWLRLWRWAIDIYFRRNEQFSGA